ncbi:MAG: ISL3 family transposase [Polyangiales bacterium]
MVGRSLGVERTVVERVRVNELEGGFVVDVKPYSKHENRCAVCLRRCPRYDAGSGRRSWRGHDFGLATVTLEADAPRVHCPEHGIHVAHVPWARPGSRFTRPFEDQVAWFATKTDKTTVATVLSIAWRSVGAIVSRVCEEQRARRDPLEGVTRIGIDEVSYRKGHRYLTVVIDHDTGRLIWAAPGRSSATLNQFFRALGRKRRRAIQLVSADAAGWVARSVAKNCRNAKLCIDPFHVVAWATKALDKVRRSLWNKLRASGDGERAKALKGSRWALLKNPEDLSRAQMKTLSELKRDNNPLYEAYLLKEQLRAAFAEKGWQGAFLIQQWIRLARSSRLAPFKAVATSIENNLEGIQHALMNGLSNGVTESSNNGLRLITRLAYGFHSPEPLIALAMLKRGGLCPPLPRLTHG